MHLPSVVNQTSWEGSSHPRPPRVTYCSPQYAAADGGDLGFMLVLNECSVLWGCGSARRVFMNLWIYFFLFSLEFRRCYRFLHISCRSFKLARDSWFYSVFFSSFGKRLAISKSYFVVSYTLGRSKWVEAWHWALRQVFGLPAAFHQHACLVLLPQRPLPLYDTALQGPQAGKCELFSLPFGC